MNTFTFPKRTKYEEERNYFWEKYFSVSLLHRRNWKYIDYTSHFDKIDLIYSPNVKLNMKGSINANIYHIIEVISDKIKINKQLTQLKSQFVPQMYFNDLNNEKNVNTLLNTTKSFFYLKGATGSISKSTFIIKDYSEIQPIIKNNPTIKNWFLSENVDSFLYKRKGSYQPNGIVYNEIHGHKGRLKFFILFKIDNTSKEVYMYDQSIYEIAPDEFIGDFKSRSQNIIIGMGSEELHGYPKDYDTDPDYGFNPVDIFGDNYFKVIVPQLGKMTHDIFRVVQSELYCKNDKYYNNSFKSCFHFGTVDVIITPELKCYFLEINTKPVMDRPSYESIINYPTMIDSIVQICIDPYFKPSVPSVHNRGWHKMGYTKRSNQHTFYVSPTWKFSKEVKQFYNKRKDYEQIIYPNSLLNKYRIDFVGKRKRKEDSLGDPIFSKGILISKILTLDHFLGNKKNMYDILSNDQRSFDFLPLTATFSIDDPNWENKIKSLKFKTWILKPSIGLRGEDIFISDNKSKIIKFIHDHSNYIDWVLSEYIDNPFLLKIYGSSDSGAIYDDTIGHKTHIRIYVLISKINGKLFIYLYDKPLLFCAAKEYNNDITDIYAQLTNLYLGSKYYNKVLKINGSMAYKDLSFSLIDILDQLYGPTFYEKNILPQIKNILKVILANSMEYLNCSSPFIPGKRNCFQNIAIDIMPDENWKLYLLEINGKPGMNAPSYHWGGLSNFTNSMMDKLTNVKSVNKKGFVLINN
jgi:hypothetical protein